MDANETDVSRNLVKAVQAYREARLRLDESSRSLESVRTEHSTALNEVAFLQVQIDGFASRLREEAPEGTPWCGPQGPSIYELLKRGKPLDWVCEKCGVTTQGSYCLQCGARPC